MSKQKALNLVQSILFIIVGILVACSIIQPNILNIILAIVLLVLGVFIFIKSATSSKTVNLLLPDGILGIILIGVSIAMFPGKIDVISPLTMVLKIAITSTGGLFIIDSIIKFCRKRTNTGIMELVIGAILLALGLMLLLWDEFGKYLWVISGVLLAVYGVYLLIITIIKLSKK